MARVVVLEFADDAQAQIFVAAMNFDTDPAALGPVMIDTREFPDSPTTEVPGTVVGIFAQPTMFCPSSGSGGCSQSKRVRAWQRGKKFGWWVCAVCKKPSGFVPPGKPNEIWRRVISQGVNLLNPPDHQNPETVNDEGWGAYREGILR